MKIACIGNVVYDCTVTGDSYPKEGTKSSYYGAKYNTGGPASTAASVIAKYGTAVDFYGQVGNDITGTFVSNQMDTEGINLNHLGKSDKVMTPQGFIIINTSEDSRTIISIRTEIDFTDPKIYDASYETGYDYILTDGKYPVETLKLMRANPKAVTIIDAGRPEKKILELCEFMDYIICSEEFANAVTGGKINDNYDNNARIYYALKRLYPKAKGITITIGKNGYICEEDSFATIKPSYDSGIKTVDTNGAGDIYHGAFTYALANDYDYLDALEFANVTASLSTTKPGGRNSVPSLEEVEKALSGRVKKYKKK